MDEQQKGRILELAKDWFRNSVVPNHIKNTNKLVDFKQFKSNPFLTSYLANFLTGNSDPESLAKALIYPRILGTSITTSFGTHIQRFTNDVLSSFGSTTSGIDIEFIDQIDGHKKYCQLKSGPETINKDDVETIVRHFDSVIHLGRTNNLRITHTDMIVGVIYGDQSDLNAHYKRLTKEFHYPVYSGQNFWHRLTGDPEFYLDLGRILGEVAIESDFSAELEKIIQTLAETPEIVAISEKTTQA